MEESNMFNLVFIAIMVSILHGMVMYLLDMEGSSFFAFRSGAKLLFLILAIAIGTKLVVYIQ